MANSGDLEAVQAKKNAFKIQTNFLGFMYTKILSQKEKAGKLLGACDEIDRERTSSSQTQ